MFVMNETHKNQMLDLVNDKKEKYEAKMWGTLISTDSKIIENSFKNCLIGGAGAEFAKPKGSIGTQYCYLGMTETGIYFVIIAYGKVEKIKYVFKVPYDIIEKVKIRGAIITPGQKKIHIYTKIGKMKLGIVNSAIASDIKGQKEALEYMCKHLESKFI